ncbi:MAG: CHRD domain-containing protein [Planctomycetes bacterium]|nr:CHRD domain-containing protein [Planctomycetota bacterium]
MISWSKSRTLWLVLQASVFVILSGCWESRPGPSETERSAQYILANASQFQCNPPALSSHSGCTARGYGRCSRWDNTFTITIVVEGLSSKVTSVHLHHAPKGRSGSVVLDMQKCSSFTEVKDAKLKITSKWEPSSGDREALKAGNIYVDVHTNTYPDGEVRGQIIPAPGW